MSFLGTASGGYVSSFEDQSSSQLAQLQNLTINTKLLLEQNPWLSQSPESLMALAGSGMDPVNMLDGNAALAGLQHMDSVATTLQQLSPVAQQASYSRMTEQQQRALASMGYSPPEVLDERGPIGTAFSALADVAAPVAQIVTKPLAATVGPVLSGAFNALTWMGDVPGHFYRTIRQMEGWQQWVALGVGAASLAFAPAILGAVAAAGLGTMAGVGAVGGVALTAGLASTALTSMSSVTNATEWWDTFTNKNGERIFTHGSREEAKGLLGQAEHLDAIARDVAANIDLYDLAEDFAGVRDSTNPNVLVESIERVALTMAEAGTPEYDAVYQGLTVLLEQEEFRMAVDTLQNGKISFGRDIARTAGIQPGDSGYNLVSGSLDALWLVALDPLLLAGSVGKLARITRRGIDVGLADEGIARIAEIVEKDAGVAAVFDQVAMSMQTDNFAALPKTWRGMHAGMVAFQKHRLAQGETLTWGRDTILEFLETGDNMKRLLEGKATVRGLESIVMSKTTPSAGWGRYVDELRQFRDGLTDVSLEKHARDTAKKLDVEADLDARVPSQFFDESIGMVWVRREDGIGYRAGQALGEAIVRTPGKLLYLPGGQSVIDFMSSITTMIPAGKSIRLFGEGSTEDIPRFVETFGRYFNVPSYARDEWLNMIMKQGTIGERRAVVTSFLDSTLTASGMRSTDELNMITDAFVSKYRQAYSAGGLDLARVGINADIRMITGTYPEAHSAVELVVPNMRQMATMVRNGHILKNVAKVTDHNFAEQAMSRFWKPGVLLRIGFIPRAAGEEMLSFFMRVGEGSMVQEIASQTVGKGKQYHAAIAKMNAEGKAALSADELAALEFRYPVHLKPLVMMGERIGWKPFSELQLDRHAAWLRGKLENGLDLAWTQNMPDWQKVLLLGREHSWRNMLANGVDPDFVEAAILWNVRHADEIMRETTSLNSSKMERDVVNPDAARILSQGADGERVSEAVVLTGERGFIDANHPLFLSSEHNRIAEFLNDRFLTEIMPKHLAALMPESRELLQAPQVARAIEMSRGVQGRPMRLILNDLLTPDGDSIRKTIYVLEQEGFGELSQALRAAMNADELTPVGVGRWIEDQAAAIEMDKVALIASGAPESQIAELEDKIMRLRKDAYRLESTQELYDGMQAVSMTERNWMASTIAADQAADDGLFRSQQLRNMYRANDPDVVITNRPKNVLYRGMSNTQTVRRNADGSITLVGQQQDNYTSGVGWSFATVPDHSMIYALGGVESGVDARFVAGAMLEVDADWLMAQYGTTWDEVLNNPMLYDDLRSVQDGGVYNVHRPGREATEVGVWSGALEGENLPEDQADLVTEMVAIMRDPNNFGPGEVGTRPILPEAQARIVELAQELSTKEFLPSAVIYSADDLMFGFANETNITEWNTDYLSALWEEFLPKAGQTFAPEITIPAGKFRVQNQQDMLDFLADVPNRPSHWQHILSGVQPNLAGYDVEDVVNEAALVASKLKEALAPEEVEAIDTFEAVLGSYIDQGQWAADSGSDFEEFDEGRNVYNELADMLPIDTEPKLAKGRYVVVTSGPADWMLLLSRQEQTEFLDLLERTGDPVLVSAMRKLVAELDHEVEEGVRVGHVLKSLTDATDTNAPLTRLIFPKEDAENPIQGMIDAVHFRGEGGWETEIIPTSEWSPFYENIDAAAEGMVNELAAMLMRPENQQYVTAQQYGKTLPDGSPVARPLDGDLARVYSPMVPDKTDHIETAYVAALENGATEEEAALAVASQLMGQVGQSRMATDVIGRLTEDQRLDLIADAVRQIMANRRKYSQPLTQVMNESAFDDPRVARWIGSVLSGRTGDVSLSAHKVGFVDVPSSISNPSGHSVAGVELHNDFGDAGKRWTLDARWEPQAHVIDANHTVRLPDGTVQPGSSFEKAILEMARNTVKEMLQRSRAGGRTGATVRGPGVARQVGSTYEPIAPGTKLYDVEDLWRVDDDGNVVNAIEWGNRGDFDLDIEEPGRDLMWNVLGPLLRDASEGKSGLTRRVPLELQKPNIPHGGKVLDKRERPPLGKVGAEHDWDTDVFVRRGKVSDLQNEGEGSLPNIVLSEKYKTVPDTAWDRTVRYGFNNVIGPMIDALARKPMSFHYFAAAYKQNKQGLSWLLNRQLFDVDIAEEFGATIDAMLGAAAVAPESLADARLVASKLYNMDLDGVPDDEVVKWLTGISRNSLEFKQDMLANAKAARNRAASEVSAQVPDTIRGEDLYEIVEDTIETTDMWQANLAAQRLGENVSPDALAITLRSEGIGSNSPAEQLVMAYHDRVPDEVWAKGHDAVSEYLDQNVGDLPALFTPNQWRALSSARENLKYALNTVEETSTLRALNNVIPFLDSHEQRTVFAEMGRNMLPFWYAEENFIKRWARTLSLGGAFGLDQLRKAQLAYMGIKSASVVRTDTNGKDWVVYPGSGLLQEAVNKIPGFKDTLPIGVLFQASTDSMLPGINEDIGSASPSPFVAVPADLVLRMFPDATPLRRSLLGDISASQGAFSQLIPTTARRAWEVAFGDEESSSRYGSAMLAAIAYAEANDQGLQEGATPAQMDEYLDKIRNHARIIMFAQAITGFIVPGSPVAIVSGEDTGSLSWLTGVGIEDPRDVTSQMYREYVSNMGVDEGTRAFLAAYPTADLEDIVNPLAYTTSMSESPSGAALPATRVGLQWYTKNQEWVDASPEAGAWFLPPDDGDEPFDYYAYSQQLANGLRKRRTPQEFLTAVKYRQGADFYFEQSEKYEDAVISLGDNQIAKRQLDEQWSQWKQVYLAAHPIFAEELQSGDGRQRRARTIEQMRYAVNDPTAPQSPQAEGIREMVKAFDNYKGLYDIIGQKRDAASREQQRALKTQFADWVVGWKIRYPNLERMWSSVYKPEAGID